jgi:acyl-CoA synthetase (NDP forming)
MSDLEKLFNPQAIGIIGVSDKPYGGGFFLRGLKTIHYEKPIYIFNPRLKGKKILGLDVYASVLEIPDSITIDYVIIAVPARKCPEILEEVGKKGIPFATIFTSGFSELGNHDLETSLLEIAQKYNIRVLGPNCLGIYVPKNKIAFSDRLSQESGNFGIVAQSGGLAVQLATIANSIYGNPPSKAVSVGNQIDLNFNDFLEYFNEDPETRVIGLYLENIKSKIEGKKFFINVKSSSLNKKPVIIWKVGSGKSTKEAIMSHTGGLAGSTKIWNALSKQTGCILANSGDELENLGMTFQNLLKLPVNRNLGVVAVGGGAAIQVTDILEQNNLNLPELKNTTREKIYQFLPEVNTIVRNPLDLGTSGIDPGIFTKTLLSLEQDPNISAIIIVWVFMFDKRSTDLIKSAYLQMKKPFICVSYKIIDDKQFYGARLNFKREMFKLKIPFYESIEMMARSLDKYCTYKEFLEKRQSEIV